MSAASAKMRIRPHTSIEAKNLLARCLEMKESHRHRECQDKPSKNPPVSLSHIFHDTNNRDQFTVQWYNSTRLRSS